MTDVFELAERLTLDCCSLRPTEATVWGVVGFDDRWGDWSPEGWDELADLLRAARRDVADMPPTDDRWEAAGRRVVTEYAGAWVDHVEQEEHLRDLNNIHSPPQTLTAVFEVQPRESQTDWEAVVARLETLPQAVAGYRACLEAGRTVGKVAAVRQVDAVIAQLAVNASDDSPFLLLAEEYRGRPILPIVLGERLDRAITGARAATAALAEYLRTEYRPHAAEDDAVGEDRYARLADRYLGDSVDLRETYEWGWEEVRSMWQAAVSVAGQVVSGASVAEVVELLKTDPARAAGSQDEFVEFVAELQHTALGELAGVHFDVPPQIASVDVRITPPGGALGAHYHGPSEDFSRPGSIWYSLGDRTTIPLFAEVTTAYHEGFPGHHLQTGIQMTLAERLTRLQRTLAWRSGYGEGWALYAERFMHEQGYLDRSEYVLGYLAAQLMRACRVVIDIGMHLGLPAPPDIVDGGIWSYEAACQMLEAYALLEPEYAESEVTRYLGWPGQAISYKMGEKTILELRAEQASRPSFDVVEFHRTVLEAGPVGLEHLRSIVRASA